MKLITGTHNSSENRLATYIIYMAKSYEQQTCGLVFLEHAEVNWASTLGSPMAKSEKGCKHIS